MSLLLFTAEKDCKRIQTAVPAPARGLQGHHHGLAQFLPSFAAVVLVCACASHRCGARHKAFNEGFLSAFGQCALWGSNVTDAEELTARAFEAFQVTLGSRLGRGAPTN